MTRKEKIENIIKGTEAAVEAMRKAGTLTEEMHWEIIANMNRTLAAVAEQ